MIRWNSSSVAAMANLRVAMLSRAPRGMSEIVLQE